MRRRSVLIMAALSLVGCGKPGPTAEATKPSPAAPVEPEKKAAVEATLAGDDVSIGAPIAAPSATENPKPGQRAAEGGIYLYREPVEMYWNDWRGVAVNHLTTGQAEVYIEGVGKTAQFEGVLSINCSNGMNYWAAVGRIDEGYAQEPSAVPDLVIKRAVKIFCDPARRLPRPR